MGLIDDARLLAGVNPRVYLAELERAVCFACGRDEHDGHAGWCPWLAMPRIVAALEAAQQVVRDGCCRQACCNDQRHDDCPHNVLREAMRDAP